MEAMKGHVHKELLGFDPNWYNWSLTFSDWRQCSQYEIMMAAIDMYLNRFPEHKHACARMGTIITRFKDCSVLTSTGYICNITGMDNNHLCGWIWTKKCADQFDRVTRTGQEYGKAHSYTPYFMALKLAPKSAYSSTQNPEFHFFYHCFGAAVGEARSKNAYKVGNIEGFPKDGTSSSWLGYILDHVGVVPKAVLCNVYLISDFHHN